MQRYPHYLRAYKVIAMMFGAMIAVAGPATAAPAEQSPFLFRGNMAYFLPNGDESYSVNGVRFPVATSGEQFADANGYGASIDALYFFTDHFATQASLGFLQGDKIDYSLIIGGQTFNEEGRMRHFTGALSLEYYIAPYGEIKPYVGAGYTFSYVDNTIKGLDFDNSSGPLVHAGADWWFTEQLGLNIEIEKQWLSDIDGDYTEFLGGFPMKSTQELDPWVFTVGLTYRP